MRQLFQSGEQSSPKATELTGGRAGTKGRIPAPTLAPSLLATMLSQRQVSECALQWDDCQVFLFTVRSVTLSLDSTLLHKAAQLLWEELGAGVMAGTPSGQSSLPLVLTLAPFLREGTSHGTGSESNLHSDLNRWQIII